MNGENATGMIVMAVGILTITGLFLFLGFRIPERTPEPSGREPAFITEPEAAPAHAAQAARSGLTGFGWLLIAVGVILVLVSFTLDITIEPAASYATSSLNLSDVVNVSLVARRAMVFEGGLALTIIGTVVACAGHVINSLRRD